MLPFALAETGKELSPELNGDLLRSLKTLTTLLGDLHCPRPDVERVGTSLDEPHAFQMNHEADDRGPIEVETINNLSLVQCFTSGER